MKPTLWRSVAMALLRDQTSAGFQDIADLWKADQNTVRLACKRVRQQCTFPNEVRHFLAAALERLQPTDGSGSRRTAPQVKNAPTSPSAH
jgi:hypothetical protein